MNIFLIPSWYPDEKNYVQGIFIKEQFNALAEFKRDSNFIVSHLRNFNLPLKKPTESLRSVVDYSKQHKTIFKEQGPNLSVIENSALAWTDKLKGNISQQVKARFENFLFARKKFGHIDLIHAHVSYPAGFAAMKLKERYGVPYIITEHMGPFPFQHFIKKGKLSEKISLPVKNSDRMIAVSSSLADKIKEYTGKSSVVIPNVVNENEFLPLPEGKLNNDKITFLTVCSLIESKGINELLHAAKNACGINERIEFIIAGNGVMKKDILSFITAHDLSDRIFLETDLDRKKVTEHFRNCDAYVLPSHHESFGVSYIEAMACGKPVIATDCGGPADFINSDNGLLVPVNDIEEISNAILYMAEHLGKYDRKVINKYFMENFSRKVVSEKIFSVYEEVTGANR
ncbi:MAG: glycosyltransferase [Ignavibacteria bacterium]